MKKLILFALIFTQTLLFASGVKNSVVKIYTTYQDYSYLNPWSMQAVSSKTGSGCLISEDRILTNAHVVSNATFIEVRKADSPKKYIAQVKFIAHDCDLAILTIEDKGFYEGCVPLILADSLQISDNVKAYGFPIGGDKITATTGIISRIEKRMYAHSRRHYLLAQTDAAINPGNSGGPILKDDRIAGIAVQTEAGQNISYMVPLPIIIRFLKDISDGQYDGIPDFGVYYQKLQNSYLREAYGLPEDRNGIFLNDIVYMSSAYGVLQTGDILLEVDGHEIADDGTFLLTDEDRSNFGILANQKQISETLKLKIWRDKKEISCSIPLKKSHFLLLDKEDVYLAPPNYFIFGGLVFVPASYGFLSSWGKRWYQNGPTSIIELYYSGRRTKEKEQAVILSQVLPHNTNKGYNHLKNLIVDTVDGKKIKNFNDFVTAVKECKTRYLRILFDCRTLIILDFEESKKVTPSILELYKIKADQYVSRAR